MGKNDAIWLPAPAKKDHEVRLLQMHLLFPCLFPSLDVGDIFALDTAARGVDLLSDTFPNLQALPIKSLITACPPWPCPGPSVGQELSYSSPP